MVVKTIAETTGSIVAELRMVPNQPLTFNGDGKPRKEDDLIGYGWAKFLDTGDATWLPRLPMVKSVASAMDCLQEWSAQQDAKIEKFVVAGASKRGWTTWMIGASDPRVEAIIPIVIDVVNCQKTMQHHAAVYGFWATAVGNYYQHKILQRPTHPRMHELYAIEDPYFYLDKLTMPKYIVNGSGDQFFCPDSSQFYFDDLQGEKHLRYVPNADHGVDSSIDAVTSMVAFYQMIIAGIGRGPRSTGPSRTTARSASPPTRPPSRSRSGRPSNPNARDFRVETIGKAYQSTPLTAEADGSYVAKSARRRKRAGTRRSSSSNSTREARSPSRSRPAVEVLPKTRPFEGINLAEVPYEPNLKKEGK
jgi:PhoPQ-activated pathogenicity-related protein